MRELLANLDDEIDLDQEKSESSINMKVYPVLKIHLLSLLKKISVARYFAWEQRPGSVIEMITYIENSRTQRKQLCED